MREGLVLGHFTGLWLARNEGIDTCSSPYITPFRSFYFPFHPFIPR